MKPQLVPTEKPKPAEDGAEVRPKPTIAAARRETVKERVAALDQTFVTLGEELRSLFIIFLALAILCAPIGLGLAAIYYLSGWAVRVTGSAAMGWIVALLLFGFLCRYVWGSRLQRASRRAAEALIARSS